MKLSTRLLPALAVTSLINATPLLSSSAQPVNIGGQHAFVAPDFAAGDIRGPCPGLNALANHGYIPHNGIVSLTDAASAINQVYGMGVDLATILAVMGTVWSGNPLSLNPGFSIGGPTTKSSNLLGNLFGLLGTPQGLDGSHNFIEADSSNTRDDLYVTGDAWTLNMNKFMEFYNMSSDPIGDYSMDMMADRANIRFKETIAENPYFYYGPFTGLVARNAGYIFSGRLFANHSSERPDGYTTKEIVRNFFSVYEAADGTLTYKFGNERLPTNWYKRPGSFGVLELNMDILSFVAKYPELASVGGNTGTVNTFTGLDLGNLTGGVYNLENLLKGNNLICFAMEVLKTGSPGSLSTLYTLISGPLAMITNALAAPLLSLACPELKSLTVGGTDWATYVQNVYPGAAKSHGGL